MSDPIREAATSHASLGVVDPIRIPGIDRLGRLWRSLPLGGKALVAAVVVDEVLRLFRVAGLAGIDIAVPATFAWELTHVAVVLLPLVLLLAQPGAAVTTPLLMRGAVVVAVAELVGVPVATLSFGIGPDAAAFTAVQLGLAAAWTAGYLSIGVGLARLGAPGRDGVTAPRPTIAGFANVVAACIAGPVVVGLIAQVLLRAADDSFQQSLPLGVAFGVSTFAYAFLARAVVRGTEDLRRPRLARSIATAGVVLAAVNAVVIVGLDLVILYQQLVRPDLEPFHGVLGLGWFGEGFARLALVVAFGLGLADTSGRMRRLDGEPLEPPAPGSEPLQWPAPGGDAPGIQPVHEESRA
jgi:hypothetical protein